MTTENRSRIFLQGEALFLARIVLRTGVWLSLPKESILPERIDAGFVPPRCGGESQSRIECRCEKRHTTDPRLGPPLRAVLKQDWLQETLDFRAKAHRIPTSFGLAGVV